MKNNEQFLDGFFQEKFLDFTQAPPPSLWSSLDKSMGSNPVDNVFRNQMTDYSAQPQSYVWDSISPNLTFNPFLRQTLSTLSGIAVSVLVGLTIFHFAEKFNLIADRYTPQLVKVEAPYADKIKALTQPLVSNEDVNKSAVIENQDYGSVLNSNNTALVLNTQANHFEASKEAVVDPNFSTPLAIAPITSKQPWTTVSREEMLVEPIQFGVESEAIAVRKKQNLSDNAKATLHQEELLNKALGNLRSQSKDKSSLDIINALRSSIIYNLERYNP